MSRYLKKKSEQTLRNLTVKVPAVLMERIEKLRADAERRDLDFDVNAAVIDALEKACRQVEKALAEPAA